MKSKIFFLFLLFVATVTVSAQDQIHLLNKSIIEAKVLTISKLTIAYKKFSNPNGPTYNLSPLEVWYIQYENGSIDSFSAIDAMQKTEARNATIKHCKNIISLHPASIVGSFAIDAKEYFAGLSYERLLAKGNFGMKGIFRSGLQEGLFSGGVQARWYPTGQGVAKYYLGLGSEVFAFQGTNYSSAANYTSVYFTNGISLNVTNRFNISAEANIGDWFTGSDDQALFYIVGIGFGVRF
jgi:hypothetical protein